MTQARYIMVGGFLGAGKTTAILRLAERLTAQGRRVGLITNDQSVGLVDTALLDAHGFAVEEITGGCFCCKFNSLVEAAGKLTAAARPDVFLAEPVGSCTDLKATVNYPLRRMYGDGYAVAPLSVLVDPVRAQRVLGLRPGKAFSPKVVYIYLKQLEEAEVIVVNKIDAVPAEDLDPLLAELRRRFPKATVLPVSARAGTNLDAWLERITADPGSAPSMDVDYDTYAEGEALLGWLNAAVAVRSDHNDPFDGNIVLHELAIRLQDVLKQANAEVAHLKMTLSPDEGSDIGVLNLVRTDAAPEMSHTLQEPVTEGELIVNVRAEIDPEFLRHAVTDALRDLGAAAGVAVTVVHLEAFRPGRPVPTHRLAEV